MARFWCHARFSYICSAYIDLNPVRAGIVKKPEDYRWSSIGLRVRDPRKANKFLKKIIITEESIWTRDEKTGWIKQRSEYKEKEITFQVYRAFLYKTGCKEVDDKSFIHADINNEAMKLNRSLKIGDKLKYRFRNLSEGIAAGSYKFIEKIQIEHERKFIKPRKILDDEDNEKLYSTRFLKPI